MSLFSKAVKSVTSSPVVKKATSVAVNTAAGFVGGGSVGATAGFARGIYKNTQTGKAETINLRRTGQAFVTGAVANVAAGAAAAGGKAIFAASGGGFSGAVGKAAAFGKSGGFAGNAGKILSGAGNLVSKGLPVFQGLFNKGVVPGTTETPASVGADVSGVAAQIRRGFQKNVKPVLDSPYGNDGATLGTTLRDKAVGAAKNFSGRFFPKQTSPDSAPVVQVNPGSVESGSNTPILLAGLGIVAATILLMKPKHG